MIISSVGSEGMKYAVRRSGSAVAYCALSTKAGTRNEAGFNEGTAHFTEHCIFKGTSHRDAASINNCLESLGGDLNAFTTKEEIVIYATVLRCDLRKAVDLLLELAFDSQFPEKEIDVEKTVVIDEIASYKDSPSEDVYDLFEEKLFEGTPLERRILGTKASVRKISSAEMKAFRDKFFTPDNMYLTVVAPLPEKKMAAMVEDAVRVWTDKLKERKVLAENGPAADNSAIPQIGNAGLQQIPERQKPFCETVDKHNHQVNCVMGGFAPSLSSEEDRLAAVLLCNMLGGPACNSILGSILREKNGWVYSVETSYTPYSDTGVVVVLFGCEKENLDKCKAVVFDELRKLREKPLSAARLRAAKRQLLGQNAIAAENGENLCISMGKGLMCFGKIATDEENRKKVNALSAAKVQEVAQKIFNEDNLNILVYL